MDNIILTGMLRDFAMRNGMESDSTDAQFEKFTNYCLWKADHYDSFEFDKVETGQCMGIDGIAIAIGGVIIDDLTMLGHSQKPPLTSDFCFHRPRHRRVSMPASS